MAGDHFRGREAGTLDELKVAVWWAGMLRTAGLEPAGDDGTYFQYFSMWRNRIAASSTISIGNHPLQLWQDVLVAQTAAANLSVPVVYAGSATKDELDKLDIKGKAIALQVSGGPRVCSHASRLTIHDSRLPSHDLYYFCYPNKYYGISRIIPESTRF